MVADVFEAIAHEHFGLSPVWCSTLYKALEYLREHPAIPVAGMTFSTFEGRGSVDLFTARDMGHLSTWALHYAQDASFKGARFFLYTDGAVAEIQERAIFFARLYSLMRGQS